MRKEKMIAEYLKDYVVIIERQAEGFSREEMADLLLTFSRSSARNDVPEIILGDDLKTLFFKDKRTKILEKIDSANLRAYSRKFEEERG